MFYTIFIIIIIIIIIGIWGERWLRLLKLSRRLYSIPGGAIGRKYVNLLAEEVMHVVVLRQLSIRSLDCI